MCRWCSILKSKYGDTIKGYHYGTPEDRERIGKLIAEEKQRIKADLAAKKSKVVPVPADLATHELRRKRMIHVRNLMKLTREEMARAMGLPAVTIRNIENGTNKPINMMMYLILAELLLEKFQTTETRIPSNLPADPKIKARVFALSVGGKNEQEIASALALRQEVVHYYLSTAD